MIDPNIVETKEQFLTFVRSLKVSFQDEPNAWENGSIDSYMEGILGWTTDFEGAYKYRGEVLPNHIDWKFIARMLAAASIYD